MRRTENAGPADSAGPMSRSAGPGPAEEEAEREVLPDALQLAVAAGAALLVGLLYLLLSDRLTVAVGVRAAWLKWLPLALEAALLSPSLVAVFLLQRKLPYKLARGLAFGQLFVLTAALVSSVLLLLSDITGARQVLGRTLLRDGALLYAINILVFAVWYWEMDGSGPLSRLQAPYLPSDLLFPQQQNGNPARWEPGFIDYLFVAFCFSTALSPADTAPLTRRAKLLMMAQATIALIVLGVLVSRSVNILG